MRLTTLNSMADEHDWTTMPLTTIIEHVDRQYHKRLEDDLPRIARLSREALESDGMRHSELHEIDLLFKKLKTAIDEHSEKEERLVFPLIRSMEHGATTTRPEAMTLKGTMQVLTHEHNMILATLVELERATQSYQAPRGASNGIHALYRALVELEDSLHAHMRIEDLVLFPRALDLGQRLSSRLAGLRPSQRRGASKRRSRRSG